MQEGLRGLGEHVLLSLLPDGVFGEFEGYFLRVGVANGGLCIPQRHGVVKREGIVRLQGALALR